MHLKISILGNQFLVVTFNTRVLLWYTVPVVRVHRYQWYSNNESLSRTELFRYIWLIFEMDLQASLVSSSRTRAKTPTWQSGSTVDQLCGVGRSEGWHLQAVLLSSMGSGGSTARQKSAEQDPSSMYSKHTYFCMCSAFSVHLSQSCFVVYIYCTCIVQFTNSVFCCTCKFNVRV